MITDITDIGALGTSDHHALQWAVQVKTVSNANTRQVYNYARADTCKIKTELAKLDWKELFSSMSVEDCWNLFKNTLQQLETTYVPLNATLVSPCGCLIKLIWLNYSKWSTVSLMLHSQQFFRSQLTAVQEATTRSWLNLTVALTPDSISSLHVLSVVGTACHKQW